MTRYNRRRYNPGLYDLVVNNLRQGLSPEIISVRLKREHPKNPSLVSAMKAFANGSLQTQKQEVVAKLNHRPRKCLNYRTPFEVFFNTKTVALVT